jgi:transposase
MFYLPPYSQKLNLIEILWKILEYFWLNPQDYEDEQRLFYSLSLALAALAKALNMNFSVVALSKVIVEVYLIA